MRVLVTAASRHGGTDHIARLIAGGLLDSGLDAEVRDPKDVATLDGYDAVVIGSAVYVGRWMPAVRELIARQAAALRQRPVFLFSSGPLGDPPKPEGEPPEVAEIMTRIGAREHRVFAGRIERGSLGIGERLIVAAVHAAEGDFRSPADIGEWTRHIARTLQVPALAI